MKAVSLFGVFVLGKVLVLAGRDFPLSGWAPLAYLWQDILVALLFAGFDRAFRRQPWIGWSVYALLVLYTSINVPVGCLLSTPLTWPLLRATRGPLADSIAYHLTWANVLRLTVMLAAGAVLPVLFHCARHRITRRVVIATVVTAALVLPLGPFASRWVPTLGLHRNVVAVLVTTALPRIGAEDLAGDWRMSPFGNPRQEDLSRYRGRAGGRNVIIIHLESTGAHHLAPYGAKRDPMPNLSALVRQAIVFDKAYTVYPETIKSFFAVQCSLHPALDTSPERYEHVRVPALATVLAGRGYRTGLFHSGRFGYLGMDVVVRNRGYHTLEDAGAIGGDHDSSFGIDEPSTVRRILGWIDDLPPGQRFLVSYLPIAGHHPYATPERGPWPTSEEINRYHNALHYSDAALGQLLRGLKARGLYDNTLFILLGDHGEAFGEHPGNYGHTLCVYEENVRVPFLIVAPGLLTEQTRVQRLASLIDTAPTVLDLLGIPAPREYQGVSLLGAQSGMALFSTDYSLGLLGLRDGWWKAIHELESDRTRLFDLQADPHEKNDVSEHFPQRASAYRDHLRHWASAQKYRIIRPQ
jgi:hypothetical protein